MLRVRLKSLRLLSTVAAASSIALGLVYFYNLAPDNDVRQRIVSSLPPWPAGRPHSAAPEPETTPLPLPDEYLADEAQSAFCTDRFSAKYLDDLRDTSFQYCNASYSSLTCFHSHTADDEERDSMCITGGSIFDANTGRFTLNCSLQEPDANATARGIIPYQAIRQYWYDTGPRVLLDSFFQFFPPNQPSLPPADAKRAEQAVDAVDAGTTATATDTGLPPGSRRYVLLVKREGAGNPWHSLLEVWSMYMTLDVLRMARDPADPAGARALFAAPDAANTQVVVLDDHDDGPYFALWTRFAARPPIRLNQIRGNPEALRFLTAAPADLRVIVPLAGSSNTLWQNDWAPRDCTRSDTMRAFVHRVLDTYGLPAEAEGAERAQGVDSPLRVTFIDRRDANTRRLVRQDALLDAVRAAHPGVDVQPVDFGSLPFADQLRVVRATDVLVGVHGAGLTHTLFLPERTAAVVEIQPADMGNVYMGFRNMANMRGLAYFRTTADPVAENTERPAEDSNGSAAAAHIKTRAAWHTENFDLATDTFVAAVGAAIQAVSNKKLRTDAVA